MNTIHRTILLLPPRNAAKVVQSVRYAPLLLGISVLIQSFLFSPESARGCLTATPNSMSVCDWDQTIYCANSVSPPTGPTFDLIYDFNFESVDLPPTNSALYAKKDTYGATDWVNPFYVHRLVQGSYNFYDAADGQHGLDNNNASLYAEVSLDAYGVNERVNSSPTGSCLTHYHDPGDPEYTKMNLNMYLYAVGNAPSGTISATNFSTGYSFSMNAHTNSNTATCQAVAVPAITLAFVGASAPAVNLAPLGDTNSGGYFTDVKGPPASVTIGSAWMYDNNGFNQLNETTASGTSSSFNNRKIVWYGDYADALNADAIEIDTDANGNETVYRIPLDGDYKNTSGDIIGQLVTYSVIPAHPGYDTNVWGFNDSGAQSFAFQVAMQLGPILASQPIYSGSSSPNPPPVVSGPPGTAGGGPGIPIYPPTFPGAPGWPIGLPVGTTTPVLGISVTDSGLTGDLEADVTAQNGVLTLGTTTGLTSVSGNGTSNVDIQGSLANVNAALASLTYQANSNFVGYDIIRVVINDLGNNGSGTPELTTTTIQVIVTPALTSGAFDANGNFQFNISGISGPNWSVWATTNLTNWTPLTNLCNGTNAFTDTNASSYSNRYYKVSQDNMNSDIIGFVQTTALGNSNYVLLANQLNNPAGNTIGVLFSNLPTGSLVEKWDPTNQTYASATRVSFGSHWSPSGTENYTLNPGEAVFVQNKATTNCPLTFIGTVPIGQQTVTIYPSNSMLSCIAPISMGANGLGFPGVSGDRILRWNPTNQAFTTYTYVTFGSHWTPSEPIFNPGEGFFVQNTNTVTTNRTWTQTFTIQ